MESKNILSLGLAMFGCLVVAFAVWTDPTGQIHTSVLTFYAETLSAILLMQGIDIVHLRTNLKNNQSNEKQ